MMPETFIPFGIKQLKLNYIDINTSVIQTMSKSEIAIDKALTKLEAWFEQILTFLWGKKLGLDEMEE